MFGVASNFRKTHGEAAFELLARTAFTEADADGSGCIDTSELQATLGKMGMQLTDAQTAAVVRSYDDDGNHELDEGEFMRLVSDLIDGSATSKLPMAARCAHAGLLITRWAHPRAVGGLSADQVRRLSAGSTRQRRRRAASSNPWTTSSAATTTTYLSLT